MPPPLPRKIFREQREEIKRQKEIERILKNNAKLEEQEKNKLEVEAYESQIKSLLSIHHQASEKIDWKNLAYELPPHAPVFYSRKHLHETIVNFIELKSKETREEGLQKAWDYDVKNYYDRHYKYEETYKSWYAYSELAKRVIAGNSSAYLEALEIINPLDELSEYNAEIKFDIYDAKKIQCHVYIKYEDYIPKQVKILSSTNKIIVKNMQKEILYKLYQDFIFSYCLRLGREVMAALPVNFFLITVSIPRVDSDGNDHGSIVIYSVLLDRMSMENLNFRTLDISDCMKNFISSGDIKILKKTGEFLEITPYSYENIILNSQEDIDVDYLLSRIINLRKEFCIVNSKV